MYHVHVFIGVSFHLASAKYNATLRRAELEVAFGRP